MGAISIRPSEHVALFGTNGSGKTTLIRYLLPRLYDRWAILDAKHDFAPFAGAKVVETYHHKYERQIIRCKPDAHELQRYDAVLEEMWSRSKANEPLVAVIDELVLLNPSIRPRPALSRAVKTGRSRGLSVWMGTQRPKDIPSLAFTEAKHFFVFQLTYDGDRDKVLRFTNADLLGPQKARGGKTPGVLGSLTGHDFVYYDVATKRAQLARGKWTR